MQKWKKALTTIGLVILAALVTIQRLYRRMDILNNTDLTPDQAGSPLYIFVFAIVPLIYVLRPVIRAKFGRAKAYLFSAAGYAVWGFGGLALCAMGLLGDMPLGAFLLLLVIVVGLVTWSLYLYRHYTNNKEE